VMENLAIVESHENGPMLCRGIDIAVGCMDEDEQDNNDRKQGQVSLVSTSFALRLHL